MFGFKCIFPVIILCAFDEVAGLLTLPNVKENEIANTSSVIRTTINALFSSLRLRNIKENPQIQKLALIHNYFTSLTLREHNALTETEKLTRVNKSHVEIETTDFIALINEILDEENVIKLQSILDETIEIGKDLVIDVEKLENLNKLKASYYNRSMEINKEVLKILQQKENLLLNVSSTTPTYSYKRDENLIDDLSLWYENKDYTSGRRIFSGKKTSIKDFPFMASVQIFNKFQCAGCIIKSDLVITAAACLQLAWNNRFYRENPPFLSVRVGSSFYEFGGETIGVQEIYFHPSYNPRNLKNNLAVMRLERKINLSKKKVKKIAVDTADHRLSKKTGKITIVGWGATSFSNKLKGPREDKLRYAELYIYPTKECREVYSKEHVTRTNFCAGFMSSGIGACNRDIGGPAIISDVLIGIISFGNPSCGTPDFPTVFTKLGFYNDWIEDILYQPVPVIEHRTTKKPRTWFEPDTFTETTTSWTMKPHLQRKIKTSSNYLNLPTTTNINILKQRYTILRHNVQKNANNESDFGTQNLHKNEFFDLPVTKKDVLESKKAFYSYNKTMMTKALRDPSRIHSTDHNDDFSSSRGTSQIKLKYNLDIPYTPMEIFRNKHERAKLTTRNTFGMVDENMFLQVKDDLSNPLLVNKLNKKEYVSTEYSDWVTSTEVSYEFKTQKETALENLQTKIQQLVKASAQEVENRENHFKQKIMPMLDLSLEQDESPLSALNNRNTMAQSISDLKFENHDYKKRDIEINDNDKIRSQIRTLFLKLTTKSPLYSQKKYSINTREASQNNNTDMLQWHMLDKFHKFRVHHHSMQNNDNTGTLTTTYLPLIPSVIPMKRIDDNVEDLANFILQAINNSIDKGKKGVAFINITIDNRKPEHEYKFNLYKKYKSEETGDGEVNNFSKYKG